MFDQAAGLRAVCSPTGIRLIPVVLSRDSETAFDLLWTLGTALSALGHEVVALDATSRERPSAPGLSQWLEGGPASADRSAEHQWQVLAAQHGLEALLQQATRAGARFALQRLSRAAGGVGVVLLLAPKEWLCVLLEDSAARPLVPFVVEPAGVVDAYSAIKVLHQAAGVRPVLVPCPGPGPQPLEHQGVRVLCETAQAHLGVLPDAWPVPESTPDPRAGDPWTPWVLRILDNALVVPEAVAVQPRPAASPLREAFAPQSWSR
jgi:hypothetical protein